MKEDNIDTLWEEREELLKIEDIDIVDLAEFEEQPFCTCAEDPETCEIHGDEEI
jgi:hypothetical protein